MKVKISASSELMKNNKQADIMSPQKKIQALQTKEGHSLFFSIGTDDVFYLTREIPGTEAGWIKKDLSAALSQYNNGNKVIAKTFRVAQNIITNTIDIVLAVQGEDQDHVYTALNLLNEDATWADELVWAVQGYDDTTNPVSKVVVNDIYIAENKRTEYIVVDILKDPSSANQFIDRYFLDPSKKTTGKVWNEHALSENLNAGKIQSCLGRKSSQLVDGLYTMGQINSENELIYTPLYNAFNPAIPANPSRLKIPQGASAMAAVRNNPQGTALFVAGDKALYYFANDKQEDGDSGRVVLSNGLFDNVTELHANASDTEVVVWGLNRQGQIFYTRCPLGRENDPTAWSAPFPIMANVTEVATYLNQTNSSNVIFAHTDGTNLVKLIQDPVTTVWAHRNIVLPSTDVNDVLEFNTYTTHIQVEGEDHLPVDSQTVQITATSPVSVYVNNQFTILSPSVPYSVKTDPTGVLTILQETETVGAVCYQLQIEGSTEVVDVNPMVKMMRMMESVKTGEDLSKVTVTNADGSKQPLVASSVSSSDKEATAQALQQFVAASKNVPQSGHVKGKAKVQPSALKSYRAASFMVQHDTIWGMSFEGKDATFHSGADAMSRFGIQKNDTTDKFMLMTASVQKNDLGDAIAVAAGDVFNWLRHAFNDVKNFFVKVVDGVYNFFLTIGNELYTFVLDCYHTIAHAVEFVFNKIKVFLEDLIKWIGFLFQWKDILRTHEVMKNVFLRYMQNAIGQVDEFKAGMDDAFKDVEKRINEWAGLKDVPGTLSEKSTQAGTMAGKHDPQSNYGSYHLQNGASGSSLNVDITQAVAGDLEKLLLTLESAIQKEGDIFEQAYTTFKTQVIDEFKALTLGQIIERTLAILADILVESVQNILDTAIDVIKLLMQGVVDMLTASIDIPVLSWLYKKITGNDLSVLDAVCLVAAIPSTLIYKLVMNEAPFPDNETTKTLKEAQSWDHLKTVFNAPQSAAPKARTMNAMAVKSTTTLAGQASSSDNASANGLSMADKFVICFREGASISSLAFIGMSLLKTANKQSGAIAAIHGCVFFTTTGPNVASALVSNPAQRWDKVLGEVIYGFTSVQKIADMGSFKAGPANPADPQGAKNNWGKFGEASKWVDFVLGICGFVPVISSVAYTQNALTITGAITNAAWNANRITTPFAAKNGYVMFAKMLLIGAYGIGQTILMAETLAEAKKEQQKTQLV